jgi:antitoxin PrlF
VVAEVVEVKISSKGQVVIPKSIRERLGVRPGDRVRIEALEGRKAIIQASVVPPEEIFVRAGHKVLEEALSEADAAEQAKIRRLLESLGVAE